MARFFFLFLFLPFFLFLRTTPTCRRMECCTVHKVSNSFYPYMLTFFLFYFSLFFLFLRTHTYLQKNGVLHCAQSFQFLLSLHVDNLLLWLQNAAWPPPLVVRLWNHCMTWAPLVCWTFYLTPLAGMLDLLTCYDWVETHCLPKWFPSSICASFSIWPGLPGMLDLLTCYDWVETRCLPKWFPSAICVGFSGTPTNACWIRFWHSALGLLWINIGMVSVHSNDSNHKKPFQRVHGKVWVWQSWLPRRTKVSSGSCICLIAVSAVALALTLLVGNVSSRNVAKGASCMTWTPSTFIAMLSPKKQPIKLSQRLLSCIVCNRGQEERDEPDLILLQVLSSIQSSLEAMWPR
jgi:hypothetical protein